MKKRLLSWLMVLTLCLTLLPTAALAVGNEGGTGSESGSAPLAVENGGGTGGESESGGTSTGVHTNHFLCGNDSCTCPVKETEKVTFQPWNRDDSLPSSGTYYLTKNVTLSKTHNVSSNLTLCLNGKTITGPNVDGEDGYVIKVAGESTANSVIFTLTDCQSEQGKITHAANAKGGGVNVGVGTFNMYGGSIADNERSEGISGVHIASGNNAVFNMYGGSIRNNKAAYGGVSIDGRGVFYMYGGEISGNTATDCGSGVRVGVNATFTVSGSAKITGNKDKDDSANNVYLSDGRTITIGGALTGDNDSIGVTVGASTKEGTVVAKPAEGVTLTADDAAKFTSDVDGYTVALNDGKLVLKVADTPTPPAEEHEHYLCGTSHTDIGDHKETTQTTFDKKLTSENDQLLVDETPLTKSKIDGVSIDVYKLDAGNYYLGGSLNLTTPIYLTSGTVNLCLNGHELKLTSDNNVAVINFGGRATLNLTDCKPNGTVGTITHGSGKYGGGVEMYIGSTFNLYGGSITGNRSLGRTGGGVNAYGTFNMYGGSITGNCAEGNYSGYSGGGVYVNQGCKFHMYGGEISGNTATENGGGVYVGGTFTVSGAAKITNNKVNGTANNVYLPVANTTLVGVIGALTDGAEIGVTPKEWPEGDGKTAIAAGKEHATSETCYTIEDSDKACFKSDNSDYEISLVSNVLVLTKKGGSTTTEKQDQAALTLAADKSTLAVGETLPLTVAGGSSTGAVTYTVSDTEKATISGNTLTAKKAGTITVKATKAGDETYNAIDSNTITITIAEKSADSTPSSSGSSSSGPRIIKTETRTAPDGSVTKTETWSDGTVTETTTGKDGSTTKTTTKKDGSSVTESKAADGTTGTVKTDKNGKTEATAKVSNKAVEDAKKSGEAVKVPTEVKAGEDSNSAPTVKVELPKNAGETKIEIPVEDASSGTVAVIVHPDGTEEIVKDSKPTEDGIQLTVDGSATVKIIDNSKDFIDTRDHWSRDEVNFVVARELFNGVGNDLFGVNQPMTRGMVNTVLARLAGVDTTPSAGQKWYEVGTAWAKANGITDGTNPEASVTREQLATLLYRFYGSPAVGGTLSFADAGAVSAYAQDALLWATQNGILNGVGNNRVAPGADAQRAQVAAMMARYLKNAG